MKLRLNFNLDKPTVNGRTYNKAELLKQFDEKILKKQLYLTSEAGEKAELNLIKIIGTVDSYTESGGDVEFEIIPTVPYRLDNMRVSTKVMGTVSDNVVTCYEVLSLFLSE